MLPTPALFSQNPDYAIIETESEFMDALSDLGKSPKDDPTSPPICDIETMPTINNHEVCDAADRFTNKLVGIALSWKDDQAVYIPISHNDGNNVKFNTIVESVEIEVLKRLAPYFRDWCWGNHHKRFDKGVLELGMLLPKIPFFTLPNAQERYSLFINYKYCSYVQAFVSGRFLELRNSGGEDNVGTDIGLKSLVLRIFGYKMLDLRELAKYSDGYHPERVSAEAMAHYACDDARWARKTHQYLYPIVSTSVPMFEVENELAMGVEEMETLGIPYDGEMSKGKVIEIDKFTKLTYDTLMSQIEEQAGRRIEINFGSPKQVSDLLYTELKMPVLGYTKGSRGKKGAERKPSTDKMVLKKLAKDFELVHNITEYRRLTTAKSTFFEGLPNYIHPHTGCIHSTFHQGGVPGGRFSSANPNAQNWSDLKTYVCKNKGNDATLELNVRDCVRVPDDEILLLGDLKQAEFWCAAEMAHQDDMLELIAAGYDSHQSTASIVWSIPIEQVNETDRKKGKTQNFALLYGEEARGTAEKQGISLEEALRIRAILEAKLAKIIAHRNWVIAFGRANGYVTTHFNQYVNLENLYAHPSKYISAPGGHADRFAYNVVVQGTAAGISKIGMVRVRRILSRDYPYLSMIHQGHDAVMFRHKIANLKAHGDLPWFRGVLKTGMEFKVPGFKLPPRVDYKVGQSFGSMITWEEGMTCDDVLIKLEAKRRKKIEVSSSQELPQRYRVVIDGEVTHEQLIVLKAVLQNNPGKNVVYLEYKGEVLCLENYGTSLSLKEVQNKFPLIVSCKITPENVESYLSQIANMVK